MVYVQNHLGQPLMPTQDHRKVRLLLKSGAAVVVRRTPFTIRLTTRSKTYVQPVTLSVDAGSKKIGLTAATRNRELFAAEVMPRNDVMKLMSDRRELRRSRRNRTTRYRQPRFDNRVHSKHKDWLAPSVEVKIQEHITAIKRACRLFPVSRVVVETAEFDLQMLKAVAAGKPVPQGRTTRRGKCTASITRASMFSSATVTPASVAGRATSRCAAKPARKGSSSTRITWRAAKPVETPLIT